MTTYSFDMTPFLAESIALTPQTWDKVNELYATEPLRFYELAKNNEWYDNYLLCGGTLEAEIIAKRALGLICAAFLDTEGGALNKKVFAIFKSGWRKIYNDVKACKKFCFNTKLNASTDRSSGNMLMNVKIIALFFAMNEKIEVDNASFTNLLVGAMTLAKIKAVQVDISDEEKSEFKKVVGDIANLKILDDNKIRAKSKVFYAVDAAIAASDLTTSNIIPTLAANEVTTTIAVSQIVKDKQISYSDYAFTLAHLVGLAAAYKNVKREYFKNNNETLLSEISLKENEIKSLTSTNLQLSDSNAELKTALTQIKKEYSDYQKHVESKEEISALKCEIEKLQEQQKELFALRTFMFEQTTEVAEPVELVDVGKYSDAKCVVVGGHETTQKKLREAFPNFAFISASAMSFDKRILENAQALFFLTDSMNHSLYYFTTTAVSPTLPIAYLRGTNQSRLVKKIVDVLATSKS